MILLLDVGNTSVKWALTADGRIDMTGHFVHRGADPERLAEQAWGRVPAPGKAFIANVAGSGPGRRIAGWIKQQWNIDPVIVRPGAVACGVHNAYTIPENLGVDRWAALIGAHHHYRGWSCIIDCGTAITLDVLTAKGLHKGGLILAGIATMQHMLLENTTDIRLHVDRHPATMLAKGTEDAVNSGAIYMAVATLDRIILDIAAGYGEHPEVVLTGGDAALIQPLLIASTRHDPDLVLKGLAVLAGET
jgi:type III pantothenate kinase